MPPSPPSSRLPDVGTTVFTVMSRLAAEHDAINLGQGFPDFPCDPALVAATHEAMLDGHNQYAAMPGRPDLLQWIGDTIAQRHGHRYDPHAEITVTAGATQALLTAIATVVPPGHEVVVIEPAYDSYRPAIAMLGAHAVAVPMTADYEIAWDAVERALTPRTRAIIVNTPHNPSGTTLSADDLERLAALVERHDLHVISDEVYEHMVYDGERHRSMASHPKLVDRSLVISSFGKTLHVTGWKVGFCAAPAALTTEFRKHHQYIVFSVNTPAQVGIATHLARHPASWQQLPAFYQARRDRFRDGLKGTRWKLLPCRGTYFQVVDYSAISDEDDVSFARWLTAQAGVAAIPMSAFHSQPPSADARHRRIRFCFAKRNETLDRALERLAPL